MADKVYPLVDPLTGQLLPDLTVSTDKEDYAPGETATITASGFEVGSTIEFAIADDPNRPGDDGDADVYQPFLATDGGEGDLDGIANGQLVTAWVVPTDNNGTGSGTPDALNATLNLTATGNGADRVFGTTDDRTAVTTFTDSGGSYTIKWYAADPAISRAPFLPTYQKLTPAEYTSLFGAYPTGSATDPLANAEAYASPAIPSNLDAVTSLAPKDLELGQIVPFFIEVTVNGSTAPENGIITITPEWLAKTTSGGNFGFDPAYGVLAAFVDKGDPQYTDTGTSASVTGINTTTLDIGGSNERIHSDITVSGLTDGDKVIVEVWVVLKDTIPTGVTGNVQTNIFGAKTGVGPVTDRNTDISTGNQTVPLLRVGEFFSSNADLSVIKSDSTDATTNPLNLTANADVDPTNLKPGDTFTYTILAKNNSTDTVANTVVVKDTLDPNVTFVSASNSGTFADNGAAADTVTWNIGGLAPGQSQLLTVTVKVNDNAPTGSLTQDLLNTVSITSITSDPNTANNTNTEPTNLGSFTPDLDITKTATVADGGTSVDVAGDVINYKIVVDNNGNQTLTNVTVSDPKLGTLSGPSGDTNNDGKLDINETWTYTGSYTVTQADINAGGSILNTATADSTETPSESASTSVPVTQSADLNITKTATVADGGTSVDVAGDVINYNIVVDNNGNQTLTNVTVSDPKLGSLTGPSGDTNNDGKLDVNETWTYTGSYTVTQADINAGGSILNTATADSTETPSESASTSVPVTQSADLNITKTATVADGGTSVDVAGDVINYNIVVDNNGNQTLTGVTVSDPKLGTLSGPSGDTNNDSKLDVNETWTYTGTYTVTQADINAGGSILNTATADSTETPSESASTSVPVAQNPDLNITKTATVADGGTSVDRAGDVVNYNIVVDNNGNQTLTGVTVSDPKLGALSGPSGDTNNDGKLDVNETWTYTGTYTVTQADINAGGSILNTATADSTETPSESASTSVPVAQNPDLNITKTATVADGGTSVDRAGDVVNYSIVVDNNGNQTLTGVTVSDPKLGALSGPSGDTNNDSKLDVNETWTYTGSYTVTQADINTGGSILNTATADSTETPSESASTSVPVAQNPDLNITKTATVPGGTADVVGEVINYNIVVDNNGNQTLTGVTVSDPKLGTLTGPSGDINNDSKLDVNETWTYTGSYTVTQADIDAGGSILNTATADSTETPSESASTSVPVTQNADLNITKTGSVPGGTADVVGEVINYNIVVDNNGNQTLTGVTVSDPKLGSLTGPSGDTDNDSKLDVDETWTYTGAYTVTQADIDAGGSILNTATADSTETPSESASTSVPVTQNADLDITKTATVADGGTSVDVAGDVINYNIVVDNNGNTTITGVTVSDPKLGTLTGPSGDTDSDGKLDVSETWTYTGSYTVTQADIDAGGSILNTATADSTETPSESASTSVPVTQNPDLNIIKTATVPGGTADVVGEVINYNIVVDNNGNQTLTGVTVSDPKLGSLTGPSGDTNNDSKLNVNETWTYTGSYTVTQADIDAGGSILNTATADSTETPSESASTSVPVAQNPDLNITKTATVADGGTSVDRAGDVVNYNIVVDNNGNQTLTNVTVSDPKLGSLTGPSGDINSDSKLNVNETWTYTGTYTVTQADIDAGSSIPNTAIADSTETPSESASTSVPVAQNPDLNIIKTATVPGGTADVVGEVINYNIVVDNNGNQTLTGVTVSDPKLGTLSGPSGDTDSDSKLDVNETWTYTGTYTVTQADIDAGASIPNTATADSTETPSESASTSVPVAQNPDLNIIKTATVPGGTADVVGEVINYNIVVDNNGNQTLTGVTVSDPKLGSLTGPSGDTNSDSKLNVNETWTYTGTYTVTQADIDAGASIPNTATADSTETPSESASTSVPVAQNPAINIDKVTVYGTQIGDGLSGVIAGQPIAWKYTVTNPGNVSLSNVSVNDNNGTPTNNADNFNATYVSGDTNTDGKLNPGESWIYTASGNAVAGSYSNIGTATGSTGGTPVTKTDSSSYFGTADVGQITPTGVTCDQYIQGTAPDFSQFYASQGGVVQYSTNKNKIGQTNPGVFFYYTGLSNAIKGFDGPDAGTAPDPITVFINQSNNGPDVVGGASNPGNTEWNFGSTTNDIKLYKVIDANNNGKIDPTEACSQVQLQSNQIVFGTGANKGDVTINFTPDAIGSLYVIGAKYDTGTVVGLPEGTRPTVNYTFNTDVGNNGSIEETDSKGITLRYKAPLTLQGTPTVGGAILTQAELAPVVGAAIDYWAKQGVDPQSLNKLKNTDVLIGDLGGTELGETVGEADGLIVRIDDDAAGYGWSGSFDTIAPNRIDLLSTVTHEFGHILGYDHDVMGEVLGVGERHLPLDFKDKNLLINPCLNQPSRHSLF